MNVDTVAHRGMVKELVDSYKRATSAGVKVGLLQPAILLMSDPQKINTIGNRIHFTGFGYCPDYKKPLSIIPKVDVAISSVSGCCMFIPKEYFDRLGGFDERYFMYMEDQEYSVRGTINGYTHLLSVGSRLVHDYTLKLSSKKIWRILKGWVRFIISYPFVSLRLTRSF
jgi:GT2 family glycosyltransferase